MKDLEKHIGYTATDLAESLEALTQSYMEDRFCGTVKVIDADGGIISIDEMIARIESLSEQAREIEKNFKIV